MPRKLIIFGNGLGMALDHNHFNLERALNDIWSDDSYMNDEERIQISRCIPSPDIVCPQGEDQLDKLHIAKTCCAILDDFDIEEEHHWLSAGGRKFPDICRTFVHRVATNLHEYKGNLPENFIEPLIEFVRNTKSHIATLNYDKLLYGSFIESRVLMGYSGSLVDGMLDSGFNYSALERRFGKNFGYYLHLHGSPLFIDDEDDNCYKMQRNELSMVKNIGGKHIVLTHIKHKPSVISSSKILRAYWQYLDFSLNEVDDVIVFGYSGADIHLNEKLKVYKNGIRIRIVEWSGAGEERERYNYWRSCLGSNIELIQLDSILDFTDW